MSTTSNVVASSYTKVSGYGTMSNMTRAYNTSSYTSYAQMALAKNATCSMYFSGFDFSDIPENATIKSVTIKAKSSVTSTTNNIVSTATVQAAAGGTKKGSSTSFKSTSASARTLSVGTWTREELDNLRIYYDVKCGNRASSSYYARVYGMDVTVEWEVATEAMYFKQNGTWVEASKVYQKVSGTWREVTDLSSIDRDKNYVKG